MLPDGSTARDRGPGKTKRERRPGGWIQVEAAIAGDRGDVIDGEGLRNGNGRQNEAQNAPGSREGIDSHIIRSENTIILEGSPGLLVTTALPTKGARSCRTTALSRPLAASSVHRLRVISSSDSIWPFRLALCGTLFRQPPMLPGIPPWFALLTGSPRSAFLPCSSAELKLSSRTHAFIGAKPGT